jgi:hypothetical protein
MILFSHENLKRSEVFLSQKIMFFLFLIIFEKKFTLKTLQPAISGKFVIVTSFSLDRGKTLIYTSISNNLKTIKVSPIKYMDHQGSLS